MDSSFFNSNIEAPQSSNACCSIENDPNFNSYPNGEIVGSGQAWQSAQRAIDSVSRLEYNKIPDHLTSSSHRSGRFLIPHQQEPPQPPPQLQQHQGFDVIDKNVGAAAVLMQQDKLKSSENITTTPNEGLLQQNNFFYHGYQGSVPYNRPVPPMAYNVAPPVAVGLAPQFMDFTARRPMYQEKRNDLAEMPSSLSFMKLPKIQPMREELRDDQIEGNKQQGESLNKEEAKEILDSYEDYLRVDPDFANTKYYKLLKSAARGRVSQTDGEWRDTTTENFVSTEDIVDYERQEEHDEFFQREIGRDGSQHFDVGNLRIDNFVYESNDLNKEEEDKHDVDNRYIDAIRTAWNAGLSEGIFNSEDAKFFKEAEQETALAVNKNIIADNMQGDTTNQTSNSEWWNEEYIKIRRAYIDGDLHGTLSGIENLLTEDVKLSSHQKGLLNLKKGLLLSNCEEDQYALNALKEASELLQFSNAAEHYLAIAAISANSGSSNELINSLIEWIDNKVEFADDPYNPSNQSDIVNDNDDYGLSSYNDLQGIHDYIEDKLMNYDPMTKSLENELRSILGMIYTSKMKYPKAAAAFLGAVEDYGINENTTMEEREWSNRKHITFTDGINPFMKLGRDDKSDLDRLEEDESVAQKGVYWNRCGASLSNAGRTTEAINCYKEALHRYPYYPRCWYNLSIAQKSLGNPKACATAKLTGMLIKLRLNSNNNDTSSSKTVEADLSRSWLELESVVRGMITSPDDPLLQSIINQDFDTCSKILNPWTGEGNINHEIFNTRGIEPSTTTG